MIVSNVGKRLMSMEKSDLTMRLGSCSCFVNELNGRIDRDEGRSGIGGNQAMDER